MKPQGAMTTFSTARWRDYASREKTRRGKRRMRGKWRNWWRRLSLTERFAFLYGEGIDKLMPNAEPFFSFLEYVPSDRRARYTCPIILSREHGLGFVLEDDA